MSFPPLRSIQRLSLALTLCLVACSDDEGASEPDVSADADADGDTGPDAADATDAADAANADGGSDLTDLATGSDTLDGGASDLSDVDATDVSGDATDVPDPTDAIDLLDGGNEDGGADDGDVVSEPDVTTVPGSVLAISLPDTAPDGPANIDVTVAHPTSQATDLVVEVTFDGGSHWWPPSVSPPPVGLATSPAGVIHTFSWDWAADVGIHRPFDAELRVTPSTGGVAGEAELAPLSATFLDGVAEEAGRNLRTRTAAVDSYGITYGSLDADSIAALEGYDLVIVHPTAGGLEREAIADLQDGAAPGDRDDDVIVLTYLSVGEDLRTSGLTSAQMLADPRFTGDGTEAGSGPRVDPRGPDADGQSLDGVIDTPLGELSPLANPATASFATYYVDDNSVDTPDPTGDYGNGLPDGNPNFGVRFVNAGDPAWFDVLRSMRLDDVDGVAGLDELLEPDIGRGFAADGVFLDTIDTAAPNSFTDSSSPNQSELEWTAPGMASLIERIDATWPHQVILQNRGLFFFDPSFPHFELNAGAAIELVLFESYRLDSSSAEAFAEPFFLSNKNALAPRVLAEAGREDGFRVLSLGYAEGPEWSGAGEPGDTLTGAAPCATPAERAEPRCSLLLDDIVEAERLAGFRHYLTDALIALVNDFVATQRALDDRDDLDAPRWSSTWNDSGTFPPGPPTPREGLQEAVVGRVDDQAIARLRWDVALDFGRVGYALYTQSTPFDFGSDPDLSSASRQVVTPQLAAGYGRGPADGIYPFELALELDGGGTTYAVLRAFDDAVPPNEDANQATLALVGPPDVTVDGDTSEWSSWPAALDDPGDDFGGDVGPDFDTVQVTNDEANLYLRVTSTNPFDPASGSVFVFIDADFDATTGWTPSGPGFGSDLLVTGGVIYGQTSTVFNTGSVGSADLAPTGAGQTDAELAVPIDVLRAVDPDLTHVRIVLLNDAAPQDFAPDFGSSLRVPLFVSW